MTEYLLLLGVIVVAALAAVLAFRQHLRQKQVRAALDRELESRPQPTHGAEKPPSVLKSTPQSVTPAPSSTAPQFDTPVVSGQPTTEAIKSEAVAAEEVVEQKGESESPPKSPQPPEPVTPADAVEAERRQVKTERMTVPQTAVAARPQRPAAKPTVGEPLLRRAGEHRGSLLISRTLPPEFERARLERDLRKIAQRSRRNRQIALAAGLAIVLLIPAYLFIPPIHRLLNPYVTSAGIRLGVIPPPPPSEPAPSPKDLEVSYSNELEAVGGSITLDGTVNNISEDKTFDKLYAELTLIKKDSKLTETRVVPIKPSKLAPKEGGRYEIIVPASEFIGNRRVRILSDGTEIPYQYVLPAGAVRFRSGGGSIRIEATTPSKDGSAGVVKP
jgi:hypothetical protein